MIEPTRIRIPIKMASSPPPSSHSPLALEHIASDDDDDGAHLITFYSSSPTKKKKKKMMPRVMQTSSLDFLKKEAIAFLLLSSCVFEALSDSDICIYEE